MSITSNLPCSVESLTDSQLEGYRKLLDSKIARLDRERIALATQEKVARRDLNEVEQEQQNRLADKSQEHRGMALDRNLPWFADEHRASRR